MNACLRRVFIMLLVGVLLLFILSALSGCGSDTESNYSPSPSDESSAGGAYQETTKAEEAGYDAGYDAGQEGFLEDQDYGEPPDDIDYEYETEDELDAYRSGWQSGFESGYEDALDEAPDREDQEQY